MLGSYGGYIWTENIEYRCWLSAPNIGRGLDIEARQLKLTLFTCHRNITRKLLPSMPEVHHSIRVGDIKPYIAW